MFNLKIHWQGYSTSELKRMMEYVAGMVEVGIRSGVLKDENGNKILEWGEEK